MSNFRIRFGAGPVQYSRQINAPKKKPGQKQPGCLGSIITVVVVLALVWLCCTGGVYWYNVTHGVQ